MMVLKDILYKVTLNAVVGSTSITINKIEFDSRQIKINDVFVAIFWITNEWTQLYRKGYN